MYKIEYGIFIGERVKGIQRAFIVTEIEPLESFSALMERLTNLFHPVTIRLQDLPHLMHTEERPRTHIIRDGKKDKGFRVINVSGILPVDAPKGHYGKPIIVTKGEVKPINSNENIFKPFEDQKGNL